MVAERLAMVLARLTLVVEGRFLSANLEEFVAALVAACLVTVALPVFLLAVEFLEILLPEPLAFVLFLEMLLPKEL